MSQTSSKTEPQLSVAVVGPSLKMTGGISILYKFVRSAIPMDVNVHWISSRSTQGPVWFSGLWVLAAATHLTKCKLMGALDVVHLNVGGGASAIRKGILAVFSRAFLRVPVLCQVHTGLGLLDKVPIFLHRPVRKALRHCDVAVILDRSRMLEMQDFFGPKCRVQVLQLGVPDVIAELQGEIPQHDDVENGALVIANSESANRFGDPPFVLFFAGLLGKLKGLDILLEALTFPDCKDVRAIIAGPGDIQLWRSRAASAGLANRVAFIGAIPSPFVHKLLSLSDAMILPSRAEGLPVFLMEALAAGSVVCVSAVGAIPQVVTHGVSGYIFPNLTPQAVASTIASAHHAKPDSAMRSAARELWEREFDIRVVVKRLVDLWRSMRD